MQETSKRQIIRDVGSSLLLSPATEASGQHNGLVGPQLGQCQKAVNYIWISADWNRYVKEALGAYVYTSWWHLQRILRAAGRLPAFTGKELNLRARCKIK